MKKINFSQVKWKVVAPLLIAIVLTIYLIISMIISLTTTLKTVDIKTIKDLTAKETYQLYKNEDRSETLEFKDYFFYGESLDLYLEKYSFGQSNETLMGKTVKFVDWIDPKNVIEFNISSNAVDNQIDLSLLKEGFYSVYVVDNNVTYRLYYDEQTSFSFNAATRNNKRNMIEFYCDKDFFTTEENKEVVLDKNYLYVEVTSQDVNETIQEYDVIISTDPAIVGAVDPKGYTLNGIVEANELYDVALIIKSKLEAEGLKVLVTKESYNQKINFYGVGGVLDLAYGSRGKYMLHLDLEEPVNGEKNKLPFVRCSSYTDGKFAKTIMELLASADFTVNEIEKCSKANNIYDYTYEIREAGGKALGAASYSATSQTNTFAKDNQYCINTVEISFGNIYSASQVNTFTSNKEAWANAIAQGIISYLK